MKTLKLNKTQKFQIDQALSNAASVLNEIRRKPLKGKALEDMKILESAVQSLEVISMK